MDELGSTRIEGIGNTVRKKRTHTFRRRPESQPVSDSLDISSISATTPSDDVRAGSSDENSGSGNSSRRKELSLSQCVSRFPGTSVAESQKLRKKNKKVEVGLDELYGNTGIKDVAEQGSTGSNHRKSSEGVLAPANWKNTSGVKDSLEPQKIRILKKKTEDSSTPPVDVSVSENKVKVKLKVGGVTRTIDTNSSSSKSSRASGPTISAHKVIDKGNSDGNNSPHKDKRGGLQGIPWKDFSRGGFSFGRENSSMAKGSGKNGSGKQVVKSDSARKNRRAPKKLTADGFDDDDDNDDEIRYLEKLRKAKLTSGLGEDEEEFSRKHRRLSKFSGDGPQSVEGSSATKSVKDGKKRSSSEGSEYDEEEDRTSDGEESGKRKKAQKEPVDSPVEPKRELTLTTRQRALQSGKDASATRVEFPNGLPPAPSRKPKEQLTEVEQQLKRAEAAQRRKMQNEKAARESEAEAIRRILGQDSNRKKKEDKKKKREEELAQEKAADEVMRASNSVRLVMGPNGTTVTFPNNMGFPSIFTSGPISYPPPREKCAGPACTNPYKYRDSKTKLPLCSLQCYKAVQGTVQSEATTY